MIRVSLLQRLAVGLLNFFLVSFLDVFLWSVESAVYSFSGPPQHHVTPQPQPQPQVLLTTEYVFVHDDASKPLLSLLYRGSHKVLRRCENFFISTVAVTLAVSPPLGWPQLVPASVPKPPDPVLLQLKKKVHFFVPVPATQLCQNPRRTVQGVTVATTTTFVQPPKYRAMLDP